MKKRKNIYLYFIMATHMNTGSDFRYGPKVLKNLASHVSNYI